MTGHVKRILLVEDDPLIQMLLEESLGEAGYIVQSFSNGDDAWSYISGDGGADLMWTDLSMPGEIQGQRLVELARSAFPHLQIIVTSGDADAASDMDFGHFLQKPFDIDTCVALVRQLLSD